MPNATYVASFIGHEPGKALFVGLYSNGKTKSLTREEHDRNPALREVMDKFGMREEWTDSDDRQSILWFDLALTDFFAPWKGKLIVGCPCRVRHRGSGPPRGCSYRDWGNRADVIPQRVIKHPLAGISR